MQPQKKTLIIPFALIAIGTGWVLTTTGVAPGVDWAWTLGVAVVGVLLLVAGGIDKVTVVLGPLFIVASLLSVLRQTDRLKLDIEVPILVILLGVLMLIARMPSVPLPSWLVPDAPRRE